MEIAEVAIGKKFAMTNGLIVTVIDAFDQYSHLGSFPMGAVGVAGPESLSNFKVLIPDTDDPVPPETLAPL